MLSPTAGANMIDCVNHTSTLHPRPPNTISTSRTCLTLLLRHTNSPTSPTRRLRMLPTNPKAPIVSQTSMRPNLLQPFQILTKLAVHAVCQDLRILAVDNVALAVEEPGGDLVLGGVLDDGYDALEFFGCEFAGTVGYCVSVVLSDGGMEVYRLFKSTSAFLQTRLE